MYPSRLDDKGRIKMPAAFQQYFSALARKEIVCHEPGSPHSANIPHGSVAAKRKVSSKRTGKTRKWRKKVAFNAADLGVEAEMDSQGRITFPPELRRELGMEDQTVRLYAYKGRIEVLSEKIYEERKRERESMHRAGGCGETGGGGAELMTYALLRHARRSAVLAGVRSGRHVPGRHCRPRGAYEADRAALDHGDGDRQRSRPEVARDGAAQHRGVERPDPVSSRPVRPLGGGGGGSGSLTSWMGSWRTWG